MKNITMRGTKAAFAAIAVLGLALAPLMMGCSSPQPAASQSSSSSAVVSSESSASAASQAGDITVSLLLTEDVAGSELQETQLQFSEEQLTVNAPVGSTALDVLQGAGREVRTEDTAQGTEVVAIGALGNGDAGEGSHWTYEVNGETQTEAPSACVLQDGDQLTFRFVA